MRYGTIIRSAAAVSLVLIPWPAGSARAANLYAVPSLALEETFDTNVFNTSGNEESDFVFRASPRLTLLFDAFQTRLSLGGGVDMEQYGEHDELNSGAAARRLDLTSAGPLRVTPRFSLRPTARFVETNDTARRQAAVAAEAPVPVLPPEEAFVTARTKRREWGGGLEAAYRLTPLVDLGLTGGGSRQEYPDDPPDLFGSTTWTGSASMAFRVSPSLSSGFFLDARHIAYDERPSSKVFSGGLSADYRFTTRHSLAARAGASYLEESADGGGGGEGSDEWSPYGRLSLAYASEGFHASLTGSYEIAGGSAGTATKRGSVALALSDRIGPRWGWNASGFVQTNRSTGDPVIEDLIVAGGTLGLHYSVARWATLSLSGNTVRQWSHGLIGEDLERHTVTLGMVLSDTYKIF